MNTQELKNKAQTLAIGTQFKDNGTIYQVKKNFWGVKYAESVGNYDLIKV